MYRSLKDLSKTQYIVVLGIDKYNILCYSKSVKMKRGVVCPLNGGDEFADVW